MRSSKSLRRFNCAINLRAVKYLRITMMILTSPTTLMLGTTESLLTKSNDPTTLQQDSPHRRLTSGLMRLQEEGSEPLRLIRGMATNLRGDSPNLLLPTTPNLRATTTSHGNRTPRNPRKKERLVARISRRHSWSTIIPTVLVLILN